MMLGLLGLFPLKHVCLWQISMRSRMSKHARTCRLADLPYPQHIGWAKSNRMLPQDFEKTGDSPGVSQTWGFTKCLLNKSLLSLDLGRDSLVFRKAPTWQCFVDSSNVKGQTTWHTHKKKNDKNGLSRAITWWLGVPASCNCHSTWDKVLTTNQQVISTAVQLAPWVPALFVARRRGLASAHGSGLWSAPDARVVVKN